MEDDRRITVISFGHSDDISEQISKCAAAFVDDLRGFLDDPSGWCPRYLQVGADDSVASVVNKHLSVLSSVIEYPETPSWLAVKEAATCKEAVETLDASFDTLVAEAAQELLEATSAEHMTWMLNYLTVFMEERPRRLLGAAFSQSGWGGSFLSVQYLFTRQAGLCSKLVAEAVSFVQTASREAGKNWEDIALCIDNSGDCWTAGVSYCRAPMRYLGFEHGLAICGEPPEEFVPGDVLVEDVEAQFPRRLAAPDTKKTYLFFRASTYAALRPKLVELTVAKRLET